MPDVYILGAGFSRAIGPSMPLLSELGRQVRERYNRPIPEDIAALMVENFELALTYLSQPKPWLPETDNLRHRALLLDFANVVAGVLEDATRDAVASMATEAPTWLETLVRRWHEQRCAVLTLNYDTLIEVVAGGMAAAPDNPQKIECRHIYPPTLTSVAFRRGTVPVGGHLRSFQLIKLHGSINWFYSGRAESFGEPIYFTPENGGPAAFWQRHEAEQQAIIREIVGDKYPYVVPPLFDKSPLFTHETIRSLWFRGWRALQSADRIICMGYSLPASDHTMGHFLKSAFAGREPTVEIVNRSDLTDHYRRTLGEGRYRLEQHHRGDDSIPDFVAGRPRPGPSDPRI